MTLTTSSVAALDAVLSPKSAWNAESVARFLAGCCLPLRIATTDAAGYPHVTSLWFEFADGRFLCCTQRTALVARHLRVRPQAGFEIAVNEPPYRGLSGQADAALVDVDALALLERLTARYLEGRDPKLRRWLLSRAATEVVIELQPRRITSWDFGRRMSAAD